MQWGTFTVTHILTLVLAAAMVTGLYFGLRKANRNVQVWVLGILSFSGIAAIIYNLVMWDDVLAYLPLHLCSINAMLLPVVVLTRNKTLGNLLLVWCLGALAALVLNYEMTTVDVFSHIFFFYYFPHVMEFGIPILLFKLGLIEKDPKCIGSTMAITMGIYTLVHGANVLLNAHYAASGMDRVANYMFSIQPVNPLVQLFYSIIPLQYWYMYLVLPIVFAYLVIVYAPQLIRKIRVKKACV